LDHLIVIRNSAQIAWTPQFTVHAHVWFGPCYIHQKLCAICLDTSVHSSCTCFIWTILS